MEAGGRGRGREGMQVRRGRDGLQERGLLEGRLSVALKCKLTTDWAASLLRVPQELAVVRVVLAPVVLPHTLAGGPHRPSRICT